MDSLSLKEYKYNGARSMVLLHEHYLNSFLKTWHQANDLNVVLPETADSDYQSLNTLLRHVFRAARGYMTWICKSLNLPDPEIDKVPETEIITPKADVYIQHLLKKWRLPLAEIPEKKFHGPTYKSRWGVDYCIDAMLEHAVMHPIRHDFQLRNLMQNR